ncbi:fumarylacetoacetate hydrolase family protein [Rhexocercosporidium sp. MPI-PUGE-AT-0058]|nr:fumarylacetoacetate hydrolase family protein [Rhexocercosporidium sp. MPI-PUGE-AT-0058]
MLGLDLIKRCTLKAQIIFYGEVGNTTLAAEDLPGRSVPVYAGTAPWYDNFTLTDKSEEIAHVLSPLPYVPIIYGVGLNYKTRVNEAIYPLCFTKSLEDVPFSEELHDMDYEGEFCVVIGKALKNLKEGEDLDSYILGYTGKSFDKFAPLGPVIASISAVLDTTALYLKMTVNGEPRQSSSVGELIYDIPTVLRYLSRGVTLQPGTVIMTGTPAGVGASFRPQKWLKDEILGIGKIKNKMVLY